MKLSKYVAKLLCCTIPILGLTACGAAETVANTASVNGKVKMQEKGD